MSGSPNTKEAIRAKNGVGRPPVMKRLGPYSRAIDRGVLGSAVDGRSKEGRFLRRYEAMLVEHVGGNPTIAQRELITRAARLALHLELMDEETLTDPGHHFTQHGHNFYVSWSNALARVLARLPAGEPAKFDPFEYLLRLNAAEAESIRLANEAAE